MNKYKKKIILKYIKKKSAFTLIETIISIFLLVGIFTISSMMYFNFIKEYKYSLERNNFFSETNFLFETISKHIKNSDIDYQSYWRENTKIKLNDNDEKKVADLFLNQGPNPNGVDSNLKNSSSNTGFNSALNCSGGTISNGDYDYTNEEKSNVGKGRFILENYKYQFIFPGNEEEEDNGNYKYNLETTTSDSKTIHLNCKTDFEKEDKNTDGNQQNIYDDDPVYGRGPKAFSGSSSLDILWSWDENAKSGTGNNLPLILVNSQGNKRVAFKFSKDKTEGCKNGSGCILFLEMNAKSSNENGISDSWQCAEDFSCPDELSGILSDQIIWQDITPENLIVTQFDFYMGPEKKSSLSFNESEYNKPSFITLKLGVKSAAFQTGNNGGRKSGIELNLQSTIIPRNNSKTIDVLN